ncbi:MAG: hypothetical protein QF662_09220, partial [Phycisphaerae bacterium]|nr:hypothetical protein [Phycisphaerae bacterium]
MASEFRTDDWDSYRMAYDEPHRAIEPMEREIAVVGQALEALRAEGIVPHTDYDDALLLAHREA